MSGNDGTERKNDAWLGRVALSTALLAVFAGITTLYMGKYSSRAVLMKAEEGNQWAYFQAKSIKQHTCEVQRDQMRLALAASAGTFPPPARRKYDETLADYMKEIDRYDGEKSEIRAKAEALGSQGQNAQHRAGNFGYALIFLQIAIMLSSVAALTRKRPLWYTGLACVTGAVFFFIDAFYLFY